MAKRKAVHEPALPAVSDPPPPRMVFWELTARCNLRCLHCRRLEVPGGPCEPAPGELTTEQARALIAQIADCGKPRLVFSGGEPLVREDLFLLAEEARGRGVRVSLATNGTLIDDATADRIAAAGFECAAISLDGATAASHDGLRGLPGAWAQALAGLRRLRARNVRLQINCTLTNRNLSEKQAVYDLAEREGAAALHFFVLVPVGCGRELADSHRLSASEVEEFLEWLAERAPRSPLQLKTTCAPQYRRVFARKGMALETNRGCAAGTGICFISHRGEVFPCGYLPFLAGNVLRQPLREIWRSSPVLAQFRSAERLEGKCGHCEYRSSCLGCRARALGVFGNVWAEDPYCAYQPAAKRK